ncbi:Pyridine nucleotide-disulfide oxidoreductase domain-containing protein 1 [Trichinella pseudospiralis]|uniref:Pyridine nucleotide-disulfide oxidoreductase domain-containing protein 1 n=1 Tax=Trichinella pseudospiralis TaxID=6337 RepID=A0A0V0YHW9_TRIPS|nr:Pyridine nucleotide-disulfide oxidoreductase domain-containing protein 1 [Trichinella pseudospiralis]
MEEQNSAAFVVVGGGIAAVACAEQLSDLLPEEKILLITSSEIVKMITNWQKIGLVMECFDVTVSSAPSAFASRPNVKVVQAYITKLNRNKKELIASDGVTFKYKKLCIATGGIPKQEGLLLLEMVVLLQRSEVTNIEVIWVVKHDSITATFIDAGAAAFLLPYINNKNVSKGSKARHTCSKDTLKIPVPSATESTLSSETSQCDSIFNHGSALGPDWIEGFCVKGSLHDKRIHIEKQCSIRDVLTPEQRKELNLMEEVLPSDFTEIDSWPVYVQLTNDKVYGCDFIVSAIGVEPNTYPWITSENDFKIADDGGLVVDDQMQTNFEDIYAAGDVCTVGWNPAPNWLQMRLWTQARQMGAYAGECMVANFQGKKMELDICFEIFTHVTKFFGFNVTMLGRFNGQGLRSDHERLMRMTPGVEYVTVLIQDGVVRGAILIGDTNLDELFENLILNEINIEEMKFDLLNPTIDIEDYFD